MKVIRYLGVIFAAYWVCTFDLPVWAAFNSGSTGADGALAPTANTTLQVPPSGVFNFTTINIPSGVTVTFTPNATNTPVTLLASGDVVISGTISVKGGVGNSGTSGGLGGAGGPGGFRGGNGGDSPGVIGGTGFGPGGGIGIAFTGTTVRSCGGGFGTYGTVVGGTSNCGQIYGNSILLPFIGGSGGAGGSTDTTAPSGGGGGGGGAILIASSGTITINTGGSINADGGAAGSSSRGGAGGGSGGAIRLIANTITGGGSLLARGGAGGSNCCTAGAAGGKGRIRLEASTISATGSIDPPATSSLPTVVALTNPSTLHITSVAGQAAPAVPTGGSGGVDIQLPPQTGPATIEVAGSRVPTGTTVTVTALPETGAPVTGTAMLSGTFNSSTASVSLTLPSGLSFITATATFSSTAALESPFMIGGEPVEKIRVAARYGGESSITYITSSGKEFSFAR